MGYKDPVRSIKTQPRLSERETPRSHCMKESNQLTDVHTVLAQGHQRQEEKISVQAPEAEQTERQREIV